MICQKKILSNFKAKTRESKRLCCFLKFIFSFFFFIIFFFAVNSSVYATAYYVSKSTANSYAIGSDLNNGTSKSTPYLTIKKAVTTLSSGDTVTINDGTYTEIPYLTFDKAATYSPETSLGVTIKGSNVTTLLTQVTSTSGTLTFGQIIFDAFNGTQTAQDCIRLQSSATKYGVTLNGTKFINCSQYFVNGTAATKLDFSATDIVGDAPAINGGLLLDSFNQGSVTIDGFTASNVNLGAGKALVKVKANVLGITASIKRVSSTLTITGANTHGIWVNNIANALVENNILTMNGLYTLDGITVGPDLTIDSSSPTVDGNTVTHNGTGGHIILVGIESSGPSVTTNNRTNNALIYNNRVTGSSNSSTLHGIMVGAQTNAIVYGNRVTNVSIGYLGKQDTNTLFSGNEANQISGQAFRSKGSTNTAFVNNSLYISTGYGGAAAMFADDNTTTYSTGIVYKNNDIYSDVAVSQYFASIPAGNDAVFGGNNYYSTSTFGAWNYQGTGYSTFASWKSAKESTALSVDPSFVNIATSHELNSTSPLYLAGVFYSSTTKDFNGNYFYNPPTVGAYEFLFPVPATSLSQYKSDGTTSISSGGKTNETTVVLKFNMASAKTTDTLTPQVEIQETGTAFTNNATNTGTAVSFSGTAVTGSVTITGLQNEKSYHWQARVTNSSGNGNWTSFGSSGNDFTIDTTNPTIGSLSSPNNYSTITNPTLIFKKSTDATSGISSYTVSLDSGKNRSFSTSGIPAQGNGSSNYVWKDDSSVKVVFVNENDNDSGNDEIQVYFKDLDKQELSEGKHTWEVTAYDNASNSTSKSTDFYIDKTNPSISDLAIANVSTVSPGVSYNLDITNRMPSFSGLAFDQYQGSTVSNSNGTSDTFDKVSSGPKTITMTIKKQNTDKTFTNYLTKDYSLTDVKDANDDKKYSRFYITTAFPLVDGYYQVTITLKDNAENSFSYPVFYLSLNQGSTNLINPLQNLFSNNLETKIIKQTTTTRFQNPKIPKNQEGYIVKIKVVDTKKNPVQGAKVTIHSKVQESVTNKDGVAEFKNVEKGSHKILIAYNNFS